MDRTATRTGGTERPSSARDSIAALKEVGQVKVWSLLVTVFGDLSAAHAGVLTSRQLNGLFDAFDIRAGALRVALHRLRKDGWIEAERKGRFSQFKMTPMAQRESDAARSSVYRAPTDQLETWVLAVSRSLLPPEAVKLNNEIAFIPATKAESFADAWVMPVPRSRMPEWMVESVLPRELLEVVANLGGIVDQIDVADDADSYRRMALRMLILHHWRRVALRNATWFLLSHKADDALMRCFESVHRKLGELGIEKLR